MFFAQLSFVQTLFCSDGGAAALCSSLVAVQSTPCWCYMPMVWGTCAARARLHCSYAPLLHGHNHRFSRQAPQRFSHSLVPHVALLRALLATPATAPVRRSLIEVLYACIHAEDNSRTSNISLNSILLLFPKMQVRDIAVQRSLPPPAHSVVAP